MTFVIKQLLEGYAYNLGEALKLAQPHIDDGYGLCETDLELETGYLIDYDFDLDALTLIKKPQAEIDARIADELLAEAKAVKLREIEADYVLAENQPVPYLTFNFNGGEESATSIDKYIRLNRLGGATSHTIWDITNVDRTLTDVEADELLLAIGGASSVNKFERKNRKLAVANATTVDEVSAI